MADIVLSTLNAKYIHAAFGLRYLLANLGELRAQAAIAEYDINQRPLEIAESLLAHQPIILGLGVYIWNVAQTTELVSILKRLRPELKIILGGPEVSYEYEAQAVVCLADHVITGEADLAFAETCARLLRGEMPPKIIPSPLPDLAHVAMPYELYADADLANRIVYVEASRGCPFSCEFCLSSLDIPVRAFPLEPFLAAMQVLLDRGCNHFKFVDRTFNLDLRASRAILEFFLARHRPGLFLHFEMVPDRLPEALRELIARFPAGSLQFEVGIQTFNEPTAAFIQRRQNYERLEDNLRFLRAHTGVHIHADLIAGLPGEDLTSFGAGFDRLVSLEPHEIQVGLLKRLRGTPISRHDQAWGMVYNPNPPYDLLENRLIPFAEMQCIRRFARYWDLVGNSGNFVTTARLLWGEGSPYDGFMRFTNWLHQQTGRTDGIALARLMELVFAYLCRERDLAPADLALLMLGDYQRGGRREVPGFLQPHLPTSVRAPSQRRPGIGLRRQTRHQSDGLPSGAALP